MSKEELLKYLIAEIDLIMHDKDYRFENQDGTWYSRESCRDLTNEEVFEELKGELRQLADLEAKLAEKEKELREVNNELIHQENYFADLKSFNNKKDYGKPIFSQMQEYLNHYKVKDKFKVYCSNCGKLEEYEFKDITFDEMTFDIYIQCKNCPRSLNTSNFPEQAVFFYKFIADLGSLQRMQDYSLIESYKCQIDSLEKILEDTTWTLNDKLNEIEKVNQDKISFVVEQLELLKEKMANFDLPNNPKLYNNDMFCGGFDSHYIKTKEQIDNQIKQLKEMK